MLSRYQPFRTLRALRRTPNATREELLAWQGRRLRALIRFAHENVAYYRDLFDRVGLAPADIRGIEDLSAIPISSTRDLRRASTEARVIAGADRRGLVRRVTSGSSGHPFTVYRSRFEDHLLQLLRIRAWMQVGVRPRDRIVSITAPSIGSSVVDSISRAGRLLRLFHIAPIDCLDPEDSIRRRLAQLAPHVITGYSGTLSRLASHVVARGAPPIRPRLLCAGGEPLTPPMRRRIEQGFGAPVFAFYGAQELNLLAWQCPASDELHTCDDGVIVEVLRDGRAAGPAESGDVVVTGLFSFTAPIIRYRIGDTATRGSDTCSCGQPFATLRDVQGRDPGLLVLPDGRRLHPFAIIGPLIDAGADWVLQHQIEQVTHDRVALRILPLRPPEPDALRRLRETGRRVLGPSVRYEVELVSGFSADPTGKFQAYRCRLGEISDVGEPAADSVSESPGRR